MPHTSPNRPRRPSGQSGSRLLLALPVIVPAALALCASTALAATPPPAGVSGATTASTVPTAHAVAAASSASSAQAHTAQTASTNPSLSSTSEETAMSKVNPLAVGSVAPGFTFRTADGKEHHTDSLRGKPYVVYFYPKDMTPGCTTQACAFRDSYADFEKAGITVIGISADSEESHDKFRSKHDLPFALASDPERKIIEAYGVWAPKLFMGKSFLGIHRITFLIGPDGKVAKVYPKVKPADNAAEVLEDARKL